MHCSGVSFVVFEQVNAGLDSRVKKIRIFFIILGLVTKGFDISLMLALLFESV